MLLQSRYISLHSSDRRVDPLPEKTTVPRDQRVIHGIDDVLAHYDEAGVTAALRNAGEHLQETPAFPRTDLHRLYDSLWKIVYGRDVSARERAADEFTMWREWWQMQYMQARARGQ